MTRWVYIPGMRLREMMAYLVAGELDLAELTALTHAIIGDWYLVEQ